MRNVIDTLMSLELRYRILLIALAVALVGGAVWSNFAFSPGTQQAAQGTEESGDEASEGARLTETQQAAISAYGSEEREAIARLQNGLWSTMDESRTLTFTERTYTVRRPNGAAETGAYAIVALEKPEGGAGDGDAHDMTLAVEVEGGVGIMRLYRYQGTQAVGDAVEWRQAGDGVFLQRGLARPVEVAGGEKEISALVGDGRYAELISDLQSKVADSYPTARTATWSGTADIDWMLGELTTAYKLDNSSGTVIEETVSFATGE